MFIIDSQQIETAQKKFIKTITFDNLIVFNIETWLLSETSFQLIYSSKKLTSLPFVALLLKRIHDLWEFLLSLIVVLLLF